MENKETSVEEVEVKPAEVEVVVSEVEEKAIKMGWTPKDQFKGDPDKWRPADEFVERGENMLPIVRATVKKQEREIAELKQAMKQFGEYHNQTEKRAYDAALATLREQRAAAIALGDGATFEKLDDKIEELRKEVDQKNQVAAIKHDPEDDPVYVEWKSKNQWINDPKLEKFAVKMGEYLRETGAKETGHEFLDLVGKKVKAEFPEKFENARRTNAPTVEGAGTAARKGGKSYADLPADARAACDRMTKNAYSDKPKEAAAFKAEYVKSYFEGV